MKKLLLLALGFLLPLLARPAAAQSPTPTPTSAVVIKDNADATGISLTGGWQVGTAPGNFYGPNVINDANAQKGSKSVTFYPSLPSSGTYDVYEWHNDASFHPNSVPHSIQHLGGYSIVSVNQVSGGGKWNLLGRFSFDATASNGVTISTAGTSGFVVADAIRWVKVSSAVVYGTFTGKTYRQDPFSTTNPFPVVRHNFRFTVGTNNLITGTITNLERNETFSLSGTFDPVSRAVTIYAASPSSVVLTGTLNSGSGSGEWTPSPSPSYDQFWFASQ